MPFSERPEDLIPGRPVFYGSAFAELGTVIGVMVESQDGRPTKIEGNPRHSGSQGAASTFAQASVLELYDPDRTRAPLEGDDARDWQAALDAVTKLVAGFAEKQGEGLALVLRQVVSPTQQRQLAQLRQRLPKVRLFIDDPMAPVHSLAAAELVGGAGARTFHALADTRVVFAADSDFLGVETDHVRLTREWARTRKVKRTTDEMSRLYVIEPHLTGTGTMADHRLRIKGSQVGDVLVALAKAIEGQVNWPDTAQGVVAGLPEPTLDDAGKALVTALAERGIDVTLIEKGVIAKLHVNPLGEFGWDLNATREGGREEMQQEDKRRGAAGSSGKGLAADQRLRRGVTDHEGDDPLTQVVIGQRMIVMGRDGDVTGVVGRKAPHGMTADDRNRVPQLRDLWIDIGAASKADAEARVEIGDAIVIDGGKMLQSGGGGANTSAMLDWTDEQWDAIRPAKK